MAGKMTSAGHDEEIVFQKKNCAEQAAIVTNNKTYLYTRRSLSFIHRSKTDKLQ